MPIDEKFRQTPYKKKMMENTDEVEMLQYVSVALVLLDRVLNIYKICAYRKVNMQHKTCTERTEFMLTCNPKTEFMLQFSFNRPFLSLDQSPFQFFSVVTFSIFHFLFNLLVFTI